MEAYSGQIEEWLSMGTIDIGLFNCYGRGSVRGAELFLDSAIVLVTSSKNGVLPSAVPFRALESMQLALPPRPNSLASKVAALAERHRVALDIVLEAGASALIRDAVCNAGLVTLVPRHYAEREYAGDEFSIAQLVKPSIQQKTWLAVTSHKPASLAVRTVARLMRQMGFNAPKSV
jgi:LysR family nitrogen assimilation transcriptional regulator